MLLDVASRFYSGVESFESARFFFRAASLATSSFLTSPLLRSSPSTSFSPIAERTMTVERPSSLPTEPTETSANLFAKSGQAKHPLSTAALSSLTGVEYSLPST